MPTRRKAFIASTLRKRIEQSLEKRALSPGDRLPSTREVGIELGADPRVVLAAYRALAEEGLVVLRPRSGVFVAPVGALTPQDQTPAPEFLTDVLVAGIVRGFSLLRFTDHLRIAGLGRNLRAVVVAPIADQAHGLARELQVDYGLQTTPMFPDELRAGPGLTMINRAHLIVTTQGLSPEVAPLAAKFAKPVIVATFRPAFSHSNWKELLRVNRVYVVVADERFLEILKAYLGSVGDLRNVKLLLAGRDDLRVIPPRAPTYVTEAARRTLGKTRVPGRLIPPTRMLAEDSVRAIIKFIVNMNLQDADA